MEENVNNTPKKAKHLFYRLLSFEGRARRSEYWLVCLVSFLVMFPALIAENIAMDYPEYAFYVLIYMVLMWIPLTYVNVAVTVRRLHDLGRNGWFVLFSFVPIMNLVIGVYVGFFKGKDEENKYGPSPY